MSDLGTMEELDGGKVRLRYRRLYPHRVSKVWQALTDPEQSKRWWAQARGALEAGGSWDLRWQNTPPGEQPMDWWTGSITELEPERVFELQNSVHGLLRWELSPAVVGATGDGTELIFTAIIDTEDRQARLSTLAGWHIHLDHLDSVLAGGSVDWPNWYSDHYPAWQQVHDEYAQVVGGKA
ncbi:uncharacterized protein YndB with AHSA1/START domain [Psychromicrobium silvestre]|uniref:Uncharacterized protein YndB with AHSA1/START domain n=1 Tax=Psychromicrobium silvestre TaxID=1645614 RepID=A0A7Y9S745_9MICC|nr:SRPBCC domain-containing protein [Psychromicrobium silvestre]NYE95838.1 uncharacterized protein YndB with AHSA1/START domain [Psychromicrobium silvestre]